MSFHDGSKLTADAVKRNFERDIALGSRASAPMVDSFRSVAAIETVGDDTVRLWLKTRCPFAMEICANEAPPPVAIEGGGIASCHLHAHGPKLGGRSLRPFLADHAMPAAAD